MSFITVYDHSRARFFAGLNAVGHTYIINLYSVLPENADATTKTEAEVGATQLATEFGYTQNDYVLTGVSVDTVNTSEASFYCDNPEWTATGGDLEAYFALAYNGTDADDAPVFRIDFDGPIIALDGDPLTITWDPDGIFLIQ